MVVSEVAQDAETDAVSALIRRCAYREAVDEVARGLGVEIGRFCHAMMGDEAAARDVLYEVMERFFDAMPSLETAPLRPWLFNAAYRQCVRRLRVQSDQDRSTATSLERPDDRRLPAEAEEARSRARLSRAALEDVSPRARGAALLRYCGRLSYADVGKICGMSETEAAKQTGRALLGLRDAIKHPPASGSDES